MHEKFTAAQVFQNQIQLPTRLESVNELNDERMLQTIITLLRFYYAAFVLTLTASNILRSALV